jgi:hypothetical protein
MQQQLGYIGSVLSASWTHGGLASPFVVPVEFFNVKTLQVDVA